MAVIIIFSWQQSIQFLAYQAAGKLLLLLLCCCYIRCNGLIMPSILSTNRFWLFAAVAGGRWNEMDIVAVVVVVIVAYEPFGQVE